jgi:putative membrane protein
VRQYAQQLVDQHQRMAAELNPLLPAAGTSQPSAQRAGTEANPSGPGGKQADRTGTSRPADPATAGRSRTTEAATAGRSDATPADGAADPAADEQASVRDRWSRMLDERKQRHLAEKSGADFDKAYLNLIIDEHEQAVDLFEDGADGSSGLAVQAFAGKYLPALREHLKQAQMLERSLK